MDNILSRIYNTLHGEERKVALRLYHAAQTETEQRANLATGEVETYGFRRSDPGEPKLTSADQLFLLLSDVAETAALGVGGSAKTVANWDRVLDEPDLLDDDVRAVMRDALEESGFEFEE